MCFKCVRYTVTGSPQHINFPTRHMPLPDRVSSLFSVFAALPWKLDFFKFCLLRRRACLALATHRVYPDLSVATVPVRYFKWLQSSSFLVAKKEVRNSESGTFAVRWHLLWSCIWKFWEFAVMFELLTLRLHPQIRLSASARSSRKTGQNALGKGHRVSRGAGPSCRAARAAASLCCWILLGICSLWVLLPLSPGSAPEGAVSCPQNPKMVNRHCHSFLVVEGTSAICFPDLEGCPQSLAP